VESLRKIKQDSPQHFTITQQLLQEQKNIMEKKKEGYYLMYPREAESSLQVEFLAKTNLIEKQQQQDIIINPNSHLQNTNTSNQSSLPRTPSIPLEVTFISHNLTFQLPPHHIPKVSIKESNKPNNFQKKERVVLKNWTNPLKRFIEEQKQL
jgi:hypothetical protein